MAMKTTHVTQNGNNKPSAILSGHGMTGRCVHMQATKTISYLSHALGRAGSAGPRQKFMETLHLAMSSMVMLLGFSENVLVSWCAGSGELSFGQKQA